MDRNNDSYNSGRCNDRNGRAIRNLRIIDYIHWQRKFSLVEIVLAIVVAMVIIDAKKWILHRLEIMILYFRSIPL